MLHSWEGCQLNGFIVNNLVLFIGFYLLFYSCTYSWGNSQNKGKLWRAKKQKQGKPWGKSGQDKGISVIEIGKNLVNRRKFGSGCAGHKVGESFKKASKFEEYEYSTNNRGITWNWGWRGEGKGRGKEEEEEKAKKAETSVGEGKERELVYSSVIKDIWSQRLILLYRFHQYWFGGGIFGKFTGLIFIIL